MRLSVYTVILLSVLVVSCGAISGNNSRDRAIKNISHDLNLGGKDLVIRNNTQVNLLGHIVRNGRIICQEDVSFIGGRFEDITIIPKGSIRISQCIVSCPYTRVFLYCPDDDRKNSVSITVTNSRFTHIGDGIRQDGSTIAAIYLQRVSDVCIDGCSFSQVGNPVASKVSAIFIGSSEQNNAGFVNNDITIRNSSFSDVYKKEFRRHDMGEGHCISIHAASNVLIDGNHFEDHFLRGFDSEAIYTKSDSVTISNNTIASDCGGEGIIVCKPIKVGNDYYLIHADIIGNEIRGNAFAAITHYGVGRIVFNTIENRNTGFLISVQKSSSLSPQSDTLFISNNTLVSSFTTDNVVFTGNCRSVLYSNTASVGNQLINIVFDSNYLDVEKPLSGCVFNIRNASNISWTILNNEINIKDKPIPLVFLQNDNASPRINSSVSVRGNSIINSTPVILIPDAESSSQDSLTIVLKNNKVHGELIKDQSKKKSQMNHVVLENNTLSKKR